MLFVVTANTSGDKQPQTDNITDSAKANTDSTCYAPEYFDSDSDEECSTVGKHFCVF